MSNQIEFSTEKCASVNCNNKKDWVLNDLVHAESLDDQLKPILCNECLKDSKSTPSKIKDSVFLKNTAIKYAQDRALIPFKLTEAIVRVMQFNGLYSKNYIEIDGELYSVFFEHTVHNSNSFKIKAHLTNKVTKKVKAFKLEDFLKLKIARTVEKN